jgi:thioredoxin-dependent peroxiredoxin
VNDLTLGSAGESEAPLVDKPISLTSCYIEKKSTFASANGGKTSLCMRELAMSDWLEVGDKAPAFTLFSDLGKKTKLSDFKGQLVVLYFYPKDDTPGCTKEACAFRDASKQLKELGAVVLGVSPDDEASHAKFRDKFSLNFPLLADPDHSVAEAYGAWREKNMYGKKSMGIQRSTYLIGADGKIAKVWKKVSVDGHDAAVLEALHGIVDQG